jgi:hypothetical protein
MVTPFDRPIVGQPPSSGGDGDHSDPAGRLNAG